MVEILTKISNAISGWFLSLREKQLFGQMIWDLLPRILMAGLLIFIILYMMPSERPFEYGNLVVGSISQQEIIAPFTFPIIKSKDVLEQERENARRNEPPVFRKYPQIRNVQEIKIKNFTAELSAFFQNSTRYSNKSQLRKDQSDKIDQLDSLLSQIHLKYNVRLSRDDLLFLYDLNRQKKFNNFSRNLNVFLQELYNRGVINISKSEIREKKISIEQNGLEEKVDTESLLDRDEAKQYVQELIKSRIPENNKVSDLTFRIISQFFEPDLIFDKELTVTRKEKAVREVPTTSGFVYENQRIIDSHEIITEEVYQKLQSLALALAERNASRSGRYQFLFFLGKLIFAVLMVLIIAVYLFVYQPKLYNQTKMLWLITCVFSIQFLITILMKDILQWSYLTIPVTLGPMLFSMVLESSLAFVGTVIISLVLGASAGNNFLLTLMAFVVGTTALFSVQKIRNRGQMFRAIFYILLGYALVNFSYGLIHYEPFKQMIQNFAFYLLPNSVLVPTAVFLLIGIFEKFFDVTTDITLLELSDLNHPLLKKLSVEAPGTFHHSIVVGNLAEAAAKEIGANSLLARVGCYYHDIGKMQLSDYFVENQPSSVSKHETLTPNMSSLILAKHVRAGLDLADEYKLPLAVKRFIPEHHGTSIMSYFYHKALETKDPRDVDENDFRYPGPKPQSKETAIAMLADTVEAASRTLPNPNLQRITALVENLIEKRFQEGELDECDITLQELNKVKKAFVRVLMGIHHIRIEYPTEEKSKEKNRKSSEGNLRTEEIDEPKKENPIE